MTFLACVRIKGRQSPSDAWSSVSNASIYFSSNDRAFCVVNPNFLAFVQ